MRSEEEDKTILSTGGQNSESEEGNSKWCGMPSRGTLIAGGVVVFTNLVTMGGSVFGGPVAKHFLLKPALDTVTFGCFNSSVVNGTVAAGAELAAGAIFCFKAGTTAATTIGGTVGFGTGLLLLGAAVGIAKGAAAIYNCVKDSDCRRDDGYERINSTK